LRLAKSECREGRLLAPEDNFGLGEEPVRLRQPDPREREAAATLRDFFDIHRNEVFFSRQLEVQNEDKYFHWISNRAIRDLREEGLISWGDASA